jgi:16S rRNA (cytosine1402-N4)-methyltransferase
MSNIHVPVLLQEVLESLDNFVVTKSKQGAVFVADCTLGGGGHTAAILQRFKSAHITAMDFDEKAVLAAKARFKTEAANNRIRIVHDSFINLPSSPDDHGYHCILADLGYSSNQLVDQEVGMSFQVDGPLDMRLSRPASGPTAWNLICDAPAPWFASVLKDYGEIPSSARIAKKIQDAARHGEITNSTVSLARWVEKNCPFLGTKTRHAATTLFQALRIAVNDELRALDQFIDAAILNLRPGGLLMIITFHSLEDRIVKKLCQSSDRLRSATKKPVEPSTEETKINPRSRSAKLRIYIK